MAVRLAKDNKGTQGIKYIDVCYNLTRDYLKKVFMTRDNWPGSEVIADFMTKHL